MSIQLICGDSKTVLQTLPTQSVHCVVTSPPYYGLRDYNVEGQLGLEDTPEQFIANMVSVFREVWRVLRNDGSLWLNIGDSYASAWSCNRRSTIGAGAPTAAERMNKLSDGLKEKDLIGIPWMLAFALRTDGWYLRSDIVWHKPNCMPESVKDRPTRSHEYLFLLTKKQKYYYDYEAIKEPAVNGDSTSPRGSKGVKGPKNSGIRKQDMLKIRTYEGFNARWDNDKHLVTRNCRDVWSINTIPYKKAHFATFPTKLIRPCVMAGCPDGGTVLDPFNGAGTTGLVCLETHRNYIGIDLNQDYINLSKERLGIVEESI
jgi:DNA modification methylase